MTLWRPMKPQINLISLFRGLAHLLIILIGLFRKLMVLLLKSNQLRSIAATELGRAVPWQFDN